MEIKRSKHLPAGEAVKIKDTDTLLHNIINSEIKQLDKELSIANNKLKKIEELISTYPSVRIIEEQGIRFAIEVSSSELVDLLKTVLKIIKGDEEE